MTLTSYSQRQVGGSEHHFDCLEASVAVKEVLCSLDTAGDITKVEVIVILEHVIGDIAFAYIFIKLVAVEYLQALGEQFSEGVR